MRVSKPASANLHTQQTCIHRYSSFSKRIDEPERQSKAFNLRFSSASGSFKLSHCIWAAVWAISLSDMSLLHANIAKGNLSQEAVGQYHQCPCQPQTPDNKLLVADSGLQEHERTGRYLHTTVAAKATPGPTYSQVQVLCHTTSHPAHWVLGQTIKLGVRAPGHGVPWAGVLGVSHLVLPCWCPGCCPGW